MEKITSTLLSEELRKELAANPQLGCGNFLQYAVQNNPGATLPFFTTNRPLRTFSGELPPVACLKALNELSKQYAAFYYAKGVRPSDPIAVYIEEGLENLVHFVALTSLGAIPILINGNMKPAIAAAFIKKARAEALFSDRARLTLMGESLDRNSLKFVETDESATQADLSVLPPHFPFKHDDRDIVLVGHSSGTTGIPKAVIFEHQQFFYGIRYRLGLPRAQGSDKILSALPHSHSAGIAYLMLAVLAGTPVRVLSDNSPEVVLPNIESFKPFMVAAFPETFVKLCEHGFEAYDLSSIRLWVNGGDAAHEAHIKKLVSVGTWQKGTESRRGSIFIDGLGSSEMGFSLFRMVHTPETVGYNRCIGSALEWVDAAILDEQGEKLSAGQVGKLGVKSPSITPGYWNDSLLTSRSRVRGYWLTGDLFFQDAEGRFYHVDRIPDAIRTSEGMVYSLQTEEFLMKYVPQLSDCTVVGVPADPNFQVPLVLVRLKSGEFVSNDDLTQRFNEVLAKLGKLPIARVLTVTPEEIPLGPTGKVLKRELRNKYKNLVWSSEATLASAR